ncbi:type II CAAX prenyl endopeptidase Rce1 family protein [Nocardiopsis sp. LOL_012]|uniref:CPBP family intramembrane glutamic endopeptidase n=1 Tax=Nocardiopsis sp. LOL_012 TaxID=3345409 RepID=UPI003A8A8057
MPWSDTLPQFSLVGTLLTVALLLFAAVGEPLLGRRALSWLRRRRDGDTRALTLLHCSTMAVHGLWGVAVVVVLSLSPGLTAADLGLRSPQAWSPVVGGAVGGLLALAALHVLVHGVPEWALRWTPRGIRTAQGRGGRRGHRRRPPAAGAAPLPEPGRVPQWVLAPDTPRERAAAAGAAVTGGVFGELLYRGLFIVLVAGMGAPLWAAAVLSVLLFSVAHLYQGWWGLVGAGASGALFTVLYLGTGSLWVPIAVHTALNLRSLVFPPVARHHPQQTPTAQFLPTVARHHPQQTPTAQFPPTVARHHPQQTPTAQFPPASARDEPDPEYAPAAAAPGGRRGRRGRRGRPSRLQPPRLRTDGRRGGGRWEG